MEKQSMTIKTPGKLMIAGEFAVLQPYHHLAVMAVDRFVYATIKKSEVNRLSLTDFQLENLEFAIENKRVKVATNDSRVQFVNDAMTIVSTYLQEQEVTLTPFMLSIKSELDDESGIKYGLGSSAAVVTSVVNAMLKIFLPEEPSKELIFKLASISHVITQGNGSGADIAASTYGGILYYSSFQADWLRTEYKNAKTVTELVEKNWTYFSVKTMEMPKDIYFCVGWTGNAASTAKLVDKILRLEENNPEQFYRFLEDSKFAVNKFYTGMNESNLSLVLEGVKENRRALAKVGEHANTPIETVQLSNLCNLAEQHGGAGKPSGAGGGDCGIAFMPSKEKAEHVIKAWEKEGIKPLFIHPYPHGSIDV
ncbi:phosphomevalonate kinase [Oceanobacillus halophilus]|uniref:phosphomevalonate kinase n=1 Tax=Oceanobacillus halophilus TaxID=930130 RepID=A0A494ZU32_9BACI|nr:phosphomevalonate kinase [Oceanobacillus halophilus]RKQ29083.1 phosphomevalonate kinase [Oceanobacillus halophilus]